MKEKIKQKGGIQIPLLIGIIVAAVITTVGTGVVLYKQGRLDNFIANVSQVFEKKAVETESRKENEEEQGGQDQLGLGLVNKGWEELAKKTVEENESLGPDFKGYEPSQFNKQAIVVDEEEQESESGLDVEQNPESEPELESDFCIGIFCSACQYCRSGICLDKCKRTDSSCGCVDCIDCNNLDSWVDIDSSYSCCNGNRSCACQKQEYRDYACSETSCNYLVTNTNINKSGCVECSTSEFCSNGVCESNCAGNDISCGSTTCIDCNNLDGCSGNSHLNYYCSSTSCIYTDDDCSDCSCSCGGYDIEESIDSGNCNDGKDNDCDGNIDLEDLECFSGTEESGIISENTTWTLENSPYIVTGNIKVEPDTILTIDPGVVVKFDGDYYLMIAGKLKSKGSPQDLITFTSNKKNPQPGDWNTIKFTELASKTYFDSNGGYIDGSIVQYCKIEYAGNSGINNANGIFIDSNIIQNNKGQWGGGIYVEGGSWTKISNNTIQHNSAGTGGGIYLSRFNGEIVNNIIFDNNSLTFGGGGINIAFVSGLSKIENNTIENNQALSQSGRGGGGLMLYGYEGTVSHNAIRNNAAQDGGGISVVNTSAEISNNIIENNNAMRGGGISYHIFSGQIISNTIKNNTAKWLGGGINGITGTGGSETIIYNDVTGNTAGTEILDWGGGGMFISIATYNDTKISKNIIRENVALSEKGGAFYIHLGASATKSCNTKINDNIIVDNDATYEIYNDINFDVDVSKNWWGTTNNFLVEEKIYDYFDDFDKGKLNYQPIVTSEIPDAGVQ